MFKGFKVVTLVFAGRRQYLELLLPQLQKCSSIDTIKLCMHCRNEIDRRWILSYVEGTQIELVENTQRPFTFLHFYESDPGTIYIKLDDDVVFVGPDAIDRLLHARVANPVPLLVSGQIINGDPRAKDSGHHSFVDAVASGDITKYYQPDHEVRGPFAINVVCYFGKDFPQVGDANGSDEMFLTVGRTNFVAGNAVFAHFSFGPQIIPRGILEQYRALLGQQVVERVLPALPRVTVKPTASPVPATPCRCGRRRSA